MTLSNLVAYLSKDIVYACIAIDKETERLADRKERERELFSDLLLLNDSKTKSET